MTTTNKNDGVLVEIKNMTDKPIVISHYDEKTWAAFKEGREFEQKRIFEILEGQEFYEFICELDEYQRNDTVSKWLESKLKEDSQ